MTRRYLVAPIAVAAAIALRLALDPLLGTSMPFITLFAAVLLAAWIGGRGPALLALGLGAALALVVIIPPRGALFVRPEMFPAGIAVFLFVGGVVIAITERMTRARRHAEAMTRAFDTEQAWLRGTLAAITDGVIASDLNGRISVLNPTAVALTGCQPADAKGRALRDVVSLRDPETGQSLVEGAANALLDTPRIGRLRARDGRERSVQVSTAPIHDPAGAPIGSLVVLRDVSAELEAKSQLQTTADRLTVALEAGRLGVWEWHPGTDRLWLSPGFESLFGHAPGTFTDAIADVKNFVHAGDIAVVEDAARSALGSKGELDVEFRVLGADRRVRWIACTGRTLRDSTGRPTRVLGLARDVTERKRAEVELEQREREFRLLADGMPLFVFVWSAGRLEYSNGRWRQWSGLSLQQTAEPRTWELLHPADRPEVGRRWRAALRSGAPFSAEFRIRRPGENVYRWHVAHTTPLHAPLGGPTRWVTAVVDVDDRLRAEQQVSRLLRIAARVNSTLDLDQLLDMLVEEAIELIGAESGAAGLCLEGVMVCRRYRRKGRVEPLEVVWGPMEGLAGWCLVHKVPYIANDAGTDPQTLPELVRRLGIRSALSTPILDPQGAVLGFFEIHNKSDRTDFTAADRDQLMAVSQSAAIAIQNALAYQRVQEAEAALKQADRRKDEFLATLAHELRNPLAPIRNALEILRLSPQDSPLAERARNMMDRQLQHLVRLLDDLVDVSRITRDRLELRRERVDLRTVIQGAVETARPLLDARKHALMVRVPDEPIFVDADPTRLAQVFANLLNNAAKYTEPGGRVELEISLPAPDRVRVSVRDNGMGLTAADRARLFTMFAQGRAPAGGAASGLGIGLALARRLIELHGGRLEATSEGEGMGSEFTAEIPVPVGPATVMPAQEGPGRRDPASRLRVLVVDDNRDTTDSLALLLRMSGHSVRTATDGLEALDVAGRFRPQVILLDLGMPRLDGFETARELRREPKSRDALLVAVTGRGQQADKVAAQAAGFDLHLTKPIDPLLLGRLLAERGAGD